MGLTAGTTSECGQVVPQAMKSRSIISHMFTGQDAERIHHKAQCILGQSQVWFGTHAAHHMEDFLSASAHQLFGRPQTWGWRCKYSINLKGF